MRTTVTLDAQLLAQAQQLCGDLERRLAALGGSQPDLAPIPRRRSAA